MPSTGPCWRPARPTSWVRRPAPGPATRPCALLAAYDRLLRETRRLVRRSDRAELEMTQLNQRLQELAGELEYRATHDPLTGVLNRAAIIERVNRHFTQQGLALIVLDIDHFKRVNDSFGHPVGDSVILGVVRCLKAAVPDTAHIGRVGGEEFTVLLPQHDSDGAVRVAEQVRAAIEAHPFGLPDASCITASFGVSWRRAAAASTRPTAWPTRPCTPPSAAGATRSCARQTMPRPERRGHRQG